MAFPHFHPLLAVQRSDGSHEESARRKGEAEGRQEGILYIMSHQLTGRCTNNCLSSLPKCITHTTRQLMLLLG